MRERVFGRAIARAVDRRAQRVLGRSRSALRRGRSDELHALRIAFKRLRYTLEFLAPLGTERVRPALEALALAQERLGTIADADAFARTYDDLLEDLSGEDERRPGLQMLRERTERDRAAALAELRALWDDGSGAPYPATLAASISAALGSISPNDA